MIRLFALASLIAVVSLAFSELQAKEKKVQLEHTSDSLPTVKERVDAKKAVLIDVRSIPEWNDGHVKGAIFLPWRDLQDTLTEKDVREKIPKDAIVYTYCAVGYRALRAGQILADYGFEVRPLKPGYEELVKAGFPSQKKE